MKNKMTKYAAVLAIIIIVGVLGWYQAAEADSASVPGNVDDPIVTKSYVDQVVAKLVREELAKNGTGVGGKSTSLEVVTVPWGSRIVVEEGGEIIVRTGKAIAYSSDKNGLSDLTDGLDIAPGKAVALNHLILAPRGGRGVEPDPTQTRGIIVLVRGSYKLD